MPVESLVYFQHSDVVAANNRKKGWLFTGSKNCNETLLSHYITGSSIFVCIGMILHFSPQLVLKKSIKYSGTGTFKS